MTLAAPRPFDLNRAVLQEKAFYPPAHITALHPLATLVNAGDLKPETALLLMEPGQAPVAFITPQLVYHHVAQGEVGGEPWLAAFCSICNGGVAFSPVIDDRPLHFSARGVYDAMILLADDETNSYWDHLTGQCVHGPLVGRQLKRLSNLLHSTVSKVLTTYPEAQVAVSILNPEQRAEAEDDDAWRKEAEPEWSPRLQSTLADEDARLPRLEMGLGLWTDTDRRYYPMTRINTADNAVLDYLGSRRVLVYVDPETLTPDAFYTDATAVTVRRDVIQLNNGDNVRDGGIFGKDGAARQVERPLQLFSRWYAFAVRFPGCEIYT
jgi:hypothetical protein